jgi:hypothetical protein
MTQSEQQAMWQERIAAFRASGKKNVTAWCEQQNISVNSMYYWLKKDGKSKDLQAKSPLWLPIEITQPTPITLPVLTVKIGIASIEIPAGFDSAILSEVVQVLQNHVK